MLALKPEGRTSTGELEIRTKVIGEKVDIYPRRVSSSPAIPCPGSSNAMVSLLTDGTRMGSAATLGLRLWCKRKFWERIARVTVLRWLDPKGISYQNHLPWIRLVHEMQEHRSKGFVSDGGKNGR